jgi:hypothetical protein
MRLKVNEEASNRRIRGANYRWSTPENRETTKRPHNSISLSISWLFHVALKQREPDCSSCEPAKRPDPQARRVASATCPVSATQCRSPAVRLSKPPTAIEHPSPGAAIPNCRPGQALPMAQGMPKRNSANPRRKARCALPQSTMSSNRRRSRSCRTPPGTTSRSRYMTFQPCRASAISAK